MINSDKFGCQAPLQECNMAETYEKMYAESGLDQLNIPATKIMQICVDAQKRLRELAAFKNHTYSQLLSRYTEAESGNCPMYIIGCEDEEKYPTLLP